MLPVDQIIHARWILSGPDNNTVLENHAIAILDGMIIDILPVATLKEKYISTVITRLPSHALIPGFVNSHTHIAMNYFRGLADDLPLMDWLNHHIWPAEKKWVQHEFVRDASLFAIAEMIRGGTTCFNDMYFFLDATAEAADMAGIRAHIGMTVLEFPTNWAENTEAYFARGLEFFDRYRHHPRITPTLAPHAPYTVSDGSFQRIQALAEEYNLKINLHLHETEAEVTQSLAEYNMRPLKRLHRLGLITPRLIAIHMTALNEEDLEIIAAGRPSIVHCPESNMKLASGRCPVQQLQSAGINVALGTDGAASNNDLDMIGEMHTAALLGKLTTGNPLALPAQDVISMATLNGARALGREALTGSITPEKAADLTAVQLDDLETLPVYHPLSQIVYAASRNQVTDVWVAGKQLLKNRQLTTLDETELKARARLWQEKIASR